MSEAADIAAMVNGGALFVINHSGGKDSQAMMIRLLPLIPRDQLLVVHASLGEAEWPGALELAQRQAQAAGVPFIVARAANTFLEMVERRFAARPDVPSWPSPGLRQCTSDLKRGPIDREVRRYAKAHGFTAVVNCAGLRAQESNSRAKLSTLVRSKRNSTATRDWWDWLPIHGMTAAEVFATIAADGQEPHPAYAAGNVRLSCVFCIMANKKDLANGAKHNPALFARYVAMEERTGYTMHASRVPLRQLVEVAA